MLQVAEVRRSMNVGRTLSVLVVEDRGDVFTGPGVCEEAKTSGCTEAYSGLRMMSHINAVAVVVHQITNEKPKPIRKT